MMERPPSKPTRLTGLYVRNFLANFAGNCIIILLNIFTPLAVYENWKAFLWQGGWIGGWIIYPHHSHCCRRCMVIGLQYLIQLPISIGLRQLQAGEQRLAEPLEKAKRRLVNLPSILGLTNLITVDRSDMFIHAADVFFDRYDDPQLFLWLFQVRYDRVDFLFYFLFFDR